MGVPFESAPVAKGYSSTGPRTPSAGIVYPNTGIGAAFMVDGRSSESIGASEVLPTETNAPGAKVIPSNSESGGISSALSKLPVCAGASPVRPDASHLETDLSTVGAGPHLAFFSLFSPNDVFDLEAGLPPLGAVDTSRQGGTLSLVEASAANIKMGALSQETDAESDHILDSLTAAIAATNGKPVPDDFGLGGHFRAQVNGIQDFGYLLERYGFAFDSGTFNPNVSPRKNLLADYNAAEVKFLAFGSLRTQRNVLAAHEDLPSEGLRPISTALARAGPQSGPEPQNIDMDDAEAVQMTEMGNRDPLNSLRTPGESQDESLVNILKNLPRRAANEKNAKDHGNSLPQLGVHDPREIIPVIYNVQGSLRSSVPFSLPKLAEAAVAVHLKVEEYDPDVHKRMKLKHPSRKPYALVYPKGTLNVQACESEDECKEMIEFFTKKLSEIVPDAEFDDVIKMSVPGRCNIRFKVDIRRFGLELNSGGCHKITRGNLTMNTYQSGTVCFGGAKSEREIEDAIEFLYQFLLPYRLQKE